MMQIDGSHHNYNHNMGCYSLGGPPDFFQDEVLGTAVRVLQRFSEVIFALGQPSLEELYEPALPGSRSLIMDTCDFKTVQVILARRGAHGHVPPTTLPCGAAGGGRAAMEPPWANWQYPPHCASIGHAAPPPEQVVQRRRGSEASWHCAGGGGWGHCGRAGGGCIGSRGGGGSGDGSVGGGGWEPVAKAAGRCAAYAPGSTDDWKTCGQPGVCHSGPVGGNAGCAKLARPPEGRPRAKSHEIRAWGTAAATGGCHKPVPPPEGRPRASSDEISACGGRPPEQQPRACTDDITASCDVGSGAGAAGGGPRKAEKHRGRDTLSWPPLASVFRARPVARSDVSSDRKATGDIANSSSKITPSRNVVATTNGIVDDVDASGAERCGDRRADDRHGGTARHAQTEKHTGNAIDDDRPERNAAGGAAFEYRRRPPRRPTWNKSRGRTPPRAGDESCSSSSDEGNEARDAPHRGGGNIWSAPATLKAHSSWGLSDEDMLLYLDVCGSGSQSPHSPRSLHTPWK
eukprot:NODE_1234_length_2552_cov_8.729485.p1 GENE.NODE_1234_length_2552_cov_8.729485~~NODE_1234_length_2552_cov_8.729485.p1  ORF type:complete len:516 (+),score=79.34 NODE_1234_length_2552_cov_8.729485:264-1811(+)